VANLLTDAPLLQKAREEAFRLVDEDPNLEALEHRDLKSVLLHKGYHQTLDHIGAG
jgi:hypothetical protein